jgi:hypothetical protein
MGIVAITLIVFAASLATAGVPDVNNCAANSGHAGFAVLMNVPNGNGSPFDEAFPILSAPGVLPVVYTDATITVVVNDGVPAPIVNYPFEDIWLESVDNGMVACTGGATADASTDAAGMTQFLTPLQAGGWSQANCQVLINGNAIPGTIALGFNSPDIDGSGAVNLTDVQLFASDFFGPYAYRSDLYYDSAVNLSDLPLLAAAFGAACP